MTKKRTHYNFETSSFGLLESLDMQFGWMEAGEWICCYGHKPACIEILTSFWCVLRPTL